MKTRRCRGNRLRGVGRRLIYTALRKAYRVSARATFEDGCPTTVVVIHATYQFWKYYSIPRFPGERKQNRQTARAAHFEYQGTPSHSQANPGKPSKKPIYINGTKKKEQAKTYSNPSKQNQE